MPILSTIGRRSPGGRLMTLGIYTLLIAGGATMIYPFLLMVSTAFTSETDYSDFRVIPRYFYDEESRYTKFLAEKYQNMSDIKAMRGETLREFEDAAAGWDGTPSTQSIHAAADWHAFEQTLEPKDFGLWHIGRRSMPGKAELLWRDFLRDKLDSDLGKLEEITGRQYNSFSEIFAPYEQPTTQLWPGIAGREGAWWRDFKSSIDPAYRRPTDAAALWHGWLYRKYERVEDFNRAAGTGFATFDQAPLPATRPDDPRLAEDWDDFVRSALPYHALAFPGVSGGPGVPGADDPYRRFLVERFGDDVATINRSLGSDYRNMDSITFPPLAPTQAELNAVGVFLASAAEARDLRIDTPDLRFIEWARDRYGDIAALNRAWGAEFTGFEQVRPPYAAEDAAEFAAAKGQWMKWFLTRNFSEVFSFIAVRGRSLQNTVVLVLAMILAALTVNPLAAYALSRFNLSYANQVLIFLLATMAFPYEVTMIPNFLLLRSFPLAAVAAALVVGGGTVIWLLRRGSRTRPWLAVLLGCAAGGLAATLTVRGLAWWAGSPDAGSISLLNTYAALILPGVASGYSIFLLKGFFDSLPEELFEAARIDGAGEMRMLWQIAVPLCMPILAVIMLFTFTATYGSYIWALVVCQDERMWTLMVHLFQLQQWAPTYVTMAANVIASIPTLLVFVLAQNMIMRGVILPTYK